MHMTTSTRWYRLGAWSVALALIVVSSWLRLVFSPLRVEYFDKIQHFAIYAVLAYFVYHGWVVPKTRAGSRRAVWIVFLLVVAFAAVDEYHQRWIPGRVTESADFLADTVGVITGFGIAALQEAVLGNRRQKSHP